MKTGECVVCGHFFLGGNRRKFCSMACKRKLGSRRRSWAHMNRIVRNPRIAASREDLYPPARREEYAARAESLAAKIGPRP